MKSRNPQETGSVDAEIAALSESMFGYTNPRREEYLNISRNGGIGGLSPAEHSDFWIRFFTKKSIETAKALDFLKTRLEGEALVDLGCGPQQKLKPFVLKTFGASRYIGVDNFYNETEHERDSKVPKITKISRLEVEIAGDMLLTVSALKNESANFTLKGIDIIIIPNSKYHRALAEEIVRTTKPGGVVFGLNSPTLDYLAESKSMRQFVFEPKGESFITDRLIFYKDT